MYKKTSTFFFFRFYYTCFLKNTSTAFPPPPFSSFFCSVCACVCVPKKQFLAPTTARVFHNIILKSYEVREVRVRRIGYGSPSVERTYVTTPHAVSKNTYFAS